jgi:hypothetical protein
MPEVIVTNHDGAAGIAGNHAIRAAIVLMLLWGGAADAQESDRTWPAVDPSKLATIYVLDSDGVTTSGRLLRFEPDAVVMLVNGADRRIASTRVRRIERQGDSLRNGALIGAVVGGILGGLTAAATDCPGSGSECPAYRIVGPLLSAAFYSAVGTGIDALVPGRTTLYVAADPSTSAGASLLPEHSRLRAGVQVSFSW